MKKIYSIFFKVGLNKAEECWEYGYFNNSTCGLMNQIVLCGNNKSIEVIRYSTINDNLIKKDNNIFSPSDFIQHYSKIFKIKKSLISQILNLTIFCKEEPQIDDDVNFFFRKGQDYGGEINVEDTELTPNDTKNALVVFCTVEANKFESSEYIDEDETAAIVIPNN